MGGFGTSDIIYVSVGGALLVLSSFLTLALLALVDLSRGKWHGERRQKGLCAGCMPWLAKYQPFFLCTVMIGLACVVAVSSAFLSEALGLVPGVLATGGAFFIFAEFFPFILHSLWPKLSPYVLAFLGPIVFLAGLVLAPITLPLTGILYLSNPKRRSRYAPLRQAVVVRNNPMALEHALTQASRNELTPKRHGLEAVSSEVERRTSRGSSSQSRTNRVVEWSFRDQQELEEMTKEGVSLWPEGSEGQVSSVSPEGLHLPDGAQVVQTANGLMVRTLDGWLRPPSDDEYWTIYDTALTRGRLSPRGTLFDVNVNRSISPSRFVPAGAPEDKPRPSLGSETRGSATLRSSLDSPSSSLSSLYNSGVGRSEEFLPAQGQTKKRRPKIKLDLPMSPRRRKSPSKDSQEQEVSRASSPGHVRRQARKLAEQGGVIRVPEGGY